MKLLLDTHIFLWYITGNKHLPVTALMLIRDPLNEVYLSVVSVWETMVKYQLGKLPLPESADIYISRQRQSHRIESLPLHEESVRNLSKLPVLHKDPFDRMLICQAMHHDLTIISSDEAVKAYHGQVSIIV